MTETNLELNDPLLEYWKTKWPRVAEQVTKFMAGLRQWNGELGPPVQDLGVRVANAFPWLWSPSVYAVFEAGVLPISMKAVDFPRIACVTPAMLPEVMSHDCTWLVDALTERADVELEEVPDPIESERLKRKRRGSGLLASVEVLCDSFSVELDNCSWIWGKHQPAFEAWWRFRHLPRLAEVDSTLREALWTRLERTIALAVILITQRRRVQSDAIAAATFWKETGNFPFAIRGSGTGRTLLVLVKGAVTS